MPGGLSDKFMMHGWRMRSHLLLALLLWPVAALAQPYRVVTLPITLDDGRVVQAQLRFPLSAGSEPMPAVMLFGGFQEAAHVLDYVQTDERLAFASFDYPFEAPRKFVFPQSLKYAPQMKAAIHGTFDGVGKLYQILKQRPEIDPRKITVAGASAGAPIAVIAASEQHIPGLVVAHGFGRITEVIAHQFSRKWQEKYGAWSRLLAWPLAWFCVWYTDVPAPEDFAARLASDQKVLMMSATQDSFIPKDATDSLWQAFERSAATRTHLRLPGDHLGRSDEQLADLLERSLLWLRDHDLLQSAQ